MNAVEILTLMGLDLAEVTAQLDAELEPAAYSPVPGAVDLTDIKPAWLTETLNRVLGIAGFGWWFSYRPEQLTVWAETRTNKRGEEYPIWCAALDYGEFYFRLVVNGEMLIAGPILGNGYSENADRGYAVRGALTNYLGAAASKIGWQLSVYQDKRSHTSLAAANPGAVTVPFGKHKGRPLGEVYAEDPSYVAWLAENAKGNDLKSAAAALLESSGTAPDAASSTGATPAKDAGTPAKDAGTPAKDAGTPAKGNGAKPSTPGNGSAAAKGNGAKSPTPGNGALTLDQALAMTMPFGLPKHPDLKGKSLREIEAANPAIIDWLADKSRSTGLKQACGVIVTARAH